MPRLEPNALNPTTAGVGRHRLGGRPEGVGIRGIPSCPNCHRALEFVMQLDGTDPAVGLGDAGIATLYVLACSSCDACLRGAVHYHRSRTGRSLCLTTSPRAIPSPIATIRVGSCTDVELGAFDEHSFEGPFHQLGGEPVWLDEPRSVRCTECGAPMTFLVALDSDADVGLEFADHGMLYAFLCVDCEEVATLVQVAPP
ncbi:MAG: hypothetical protein KDB80_04290 [Planctomycetes bacterium]|nr:hypothetical protein [Planctomycetota bacterium]